MFSEFTPDSGLHVCPVIKPGNYLIMFDSMFN